MPKKKSFKTPARLAPLFRAGKIGSLEVKNRLVMPPMVRNYADDEGRVTDRYVAHVERIARGGVGTIILEASYVRADGRGFVNELGVDDDTSVAGLMKLADVAHRHGAAVGLQIFHGGRQASSKTSGFPPIAPSAIPEPTVGERPKALTIKEIKDIVRAFGDAAERVKKAGLDFVELHGAHGYLITQFLSPFSNKRVDAYGGTPERRLRFLLEVYAEVRRRVGDDFPVILRLSADEFVPGGLRLKDTVAVAKRLEKEGVDAIHVSSGNYASYAQGMMISPMAVADAPLVPFAAAVRRAVKIPVIAVDKIRRPETAAKILRDKAADFVAVGRSLLADPDWPQKAKEGRLKDIRPCIACNQGCISRLFAQEDVWCTVNPECGREREFSVKPPPAGKHGSGKRRVWVIGGGPAGLTAAIVAAERGHKVTVFEKERRLGGQLTAAAAAPYRRDWADFRDWLTRRVKDLPIDVRLGHEFTTDDFRRSSPDVVVVAAGSAAARPHLPGADLKNVMVARDLLEGKVKLKPRSRVVVAGGGCMGAQTAEYLADRGHRVTLVEATETMASEAPVDDRALLLERLAKKKVKMLTRTAVGSINPEDVQVRAPSGQAKLPADEVVICLGAVPNDGLIAELEGVVPRTIIVGDALEPRRVTEAVAEAAQAMLSV